MTVADDLLAVLRQRSDAPSDPSLFLQWCGQPESPPIGGVSRFLVALWKSRPDLQHNFPGFYLDPDAQQAYIAWAHRHAAAETHAPNELIPDALAASVSSEVSPLAAGHRQRGVGVVGYLRAVLGLGEAARRVVDLLNLTDERIRTYAYDHTHAALTVPWEDRQDVALPDVLISVFAPAPYENVRSILGNRATAGTYRVAVVFWETANVPPVFAQRFEDVDEVWVTSEFTADALRPILKNRPVFVLPLGVTAQPVSEQQLHEVRQKWSVRLGISNTTRVVGQTFDYASRIERKNPIGLVEAWKAAFPHEDAMKQVLVLKSVNEIAGDEQSQAVAAAVGHRSDIIRFDSVLSQDEQSELFARFDVLASLHRAEGYGLTLLEAMARGIPVMASQYSGNLAFMSPQNSWLVPCAETELSYDAGPYPAGSRWGEPRITDAAVMLADLVNGLGSKTVGERVARAQTDVADLVSGVAGARFIEHRLAYIRSTRGAGNQPA
jgi:glycosyltransferase involved in cell wall biosynthesis